MNLRALDPLIARRNTEIETLSHCGALTDQGRRETTIFDIPRAKRLSNLAAESLSDCR
jgi:hypothetical protein